MLKFFFAFIFFSVSKNNRKEKDSKTETSKLKNAYKEKENIEISQDNWNILLKNSGTLKKMLEDIEEPNFDQSIPFALAAEPIKKLISLLAQLDKKANLQQHIDALNTNDLADLLNVAHYLEVIPVIKATSKTLAKKIVQHDPEIDTIFTTNNAQLLKKIEYIFPIISKKINSHILSPLLPQLKYSEIVLDRESEKLKFNSFSGKFHHITAETDKSNNQLVLKKKSGFSPDNNTVFNVSINGDIHLHNLKTSERTAISGYDNLIGFGYKGKTLVVEKNKILQIIETKTRNLIRPIDTGTHFTDEISFSPDNKIIMLSFNDKDKTVFLADSLTGNEIQRFTGHQTSIRYVTFSPCKNYIAVTCYPQLDNNDRYIWNVKTGEFITTMKNSEVCEFSSTGETCLLGNRNNLSLINMKNNTIIKNFTNYTNYEYSNDGKIVACSSENGIIELFETSTGDFIGRLTGHSNEIPVLLAYGKNNFVSFSDDNTVRFWDTNSRSCIKTLPYNSEYKYGYWQESFGDRKIKASNYDGLGLWNTETGTFYSLPKVNFKFSFDGNNNLITKDENRNVFSIWNTDNGKQINKCASSAKICFHGINPTNSSIITMSENGQISLLRPSIASENLSAQQALTLAYITKKSHTTPLDISDNKQLLTSFEQLDPQLQNVLINNYQIQTPSTKFARKVKIGALIIGTGAVLYGGYKIANSDFMKNLFSQRQITHTKNN